MLLVEPIERINEYLIRDFGKWDDGRARFRVVWSEDQIEKINSWHTDEGFDLLTPRVTERPKYQYIEGRYILEQLSIVPDHDKELTERFSYEPLWVFQDNKGGYLPPRWDACKLIIEAMYKNRVQAGSFKKYTRDEAVAAQQEMKEIEDQLFGNESDVTDALHLGYGVTVQKEKDKKETIQ